LSDSLSILYLHGFASSPQSRKARFFSGKLEALGARVRIPDLAEGDFEHLTISRQLKLIEELAGDGPHTLIGSSLGGYLAALYAAGHANINRILLLAPAFGFCELWQAALGWQRIAAWRSAGSIEVFHYGAGQEMPLAYEFLEDASRYSPFPAVQQPALLVHGNQDAVVPVEQSLAFVRGCPQARLLRYDTGHELTDVLDRIWYEAEPFLAGGRNVY
jgi:uncharacterized protein